MSTHRIDLKDAELISDRMEKHLERVERED